VDYFESPVICLYCRVDQVLDQLAKEVCMQLVDQPAMVTRPCMYVTHILFYCDLCDGDMILFSSFFVALNGI